jgi:hypothetical protein
MRDPCHQPVSWWMLQNKLFLARNTSGFQDFLESPFACLEKPSHRKQFSRPGQEEFNEWSDITAFPGW